MTTTTILDMPTIRALVGTAPVRGPAGRGGAPGALGSRTRTDHGTGLAQVAQVAGLTLTATPARHFCGRAVHRRTLWASWVASGPRHQVFHSGDTGYFPGFAEIGAAHGPFDAVMMQIGTYERLLAGHPHDTEEGLRAASTWAEASRTACCCRSTRGTFNLAPHPWEEPAERTYAAAAEARARVALPIPGQPLNLAANCLKPRGGARWQRPHPTRPRPSRLAARRALRRSGPAAAAAVTPTRNRAAAVCRGPVSTCVARSPARRFPRAVADGRRGGTSSEEAADLVSWL